MNANRRRFKKLRLLAAAWLYFRVLAPRRSGWLRVPPAMDDVSRAQVVGVPGSLAPDARPTEWTDAPTVATGSTLGWLPILTACAALGILLIAVADARSRSMTSSSQTIFWIGLLLVYAPTVLRLVGRSAGRHERLALILLIGLSFYAVKVIQSPFGFTYADELAHVPNVNSILETHRLFGANSILPVTADYPGLESLTAALASMSGLSAFGAGLIVIGAARVVMVLALFLLFERVSGSPRVASLGVAIYATNANFLFFGAQFSYESLALPLLVLVLFGVAEWRDASSRAGWSAVILVVTFAVVVTHHITSYALAIVLASLSAFYFVFARKRFRQAPWAFALFAFAATIGWLILVASKTVGYLTPVFTQALHSTLRTVSGEAAPRRLFSASGSGGNLASGLARGVGFGSVLLMAAGFPFGLMAVWRRFRSDPLALLLALLGAGVFATYLLRFAPAAWETADRASEFLFIGLAFVLGLIGFDRRVPGRMSAIRSLFATVCLGVIMTGGVVSGWTPSLRLSQPYRIKAGSQTIDPEGRTMAGWALLHLGPGRRYAASASDARLLAAYARGYAIEGSSPDVVEVLESATLPSWELAVLRTNRLRFVVTDLRRKSFDNQAGYYFGFRPGTGKPDSLYPFANAQKFERIRTNLIYDSGTIRIFDLGPKP